MPKEYTVQQPLTPQERNIASRYGLDNWTTNAYVNSRNHPDMGGNMGFMSGPVPYRHQDELSGQKQKGIAGDYRNIHIDYRRQKSRAALHAPLNYQTPFSGQPN